MKKLALNTLVLGLSLSLAGTAFASEFTNMDPITLRLAHVVNEQDGFHIAE